MTIKNKKIVLSIIGIICILAVVYVLFESRPASDPKIENNQDYTSMHASEFAVGGESSATNGSGTSLSLEVEKCSRGLDTVYFGFGHTKFAVEGIQAGRCVFSHGTEIENPEWDGNLDTKCIVPTTKSISLTVTDMGIDFQPIEQYCT